MPALAAVLAIAAAGGGWWAWSSATKARRVREQMLPQIAALAEEGRFSRAYSLAVEARRVIPNEPSIEGLWHQISRKISIDMTI